MDTSGKTIFSPSCNGRFVIRQKACLLLLITLILIPLGLGIGTEAALAGSLSSVTPMGASPAVTTLNATTGMRRLTVKVPAGLPAGTTALRNLNAAAGEVSTGMSMEVVEINLPEGSA